MKKKVLIIILAVCTLTSVLYCPKASNLSDVTLENVEALAVVGGEGSEGGGKKCYNTITSKDGCKVFYCQTCTWVDGTDALFSGTDNCP